MVKRETIPAWKILKVFRRDKFTCQYCGAKGIDLEIDHVIPVALGGSNSEVNLVTACRRCNCKKGEKKADEFRTTVTYLRGEEEKPTDTPVFISEQVGIKPELDKLGKGYVFYYEHNNQKIEVPASREFIDMFLKAIKEIQSNEQNLQLA